MPDPTGAGASDATPDSAADLALLRDAATGAAEIALAHWRRDPDTWEKPGDEGPVTEADLAVDKYLRERLAAARPDYGWMSEETPDNLRHRDADTLFIVDPIDGTRAFVKGEPIWAHALAVVHRGRPIAAIVHLPALAHVYAATRDGGATRDGVPIRVAEAPGLDAAEMLVTKPNLAAHLWAGPVPALTRHFRPSLAYRLALVAEGRFHGMLTLRDSWDWDVAAGALIASEAGATVSDRAGAPLAFNARHRKTAGVIAAPAALHAETLSRLAPGAWTD